jgi:N-acetylmuramoyl-L-alanine amidase-like
MPSHSNFHAHSRHALAMLAAFGCISSILPQLAPALAQPVPESPSQAVQQDLDRPFELTPEQLAVLERDRVDLQQLAPLFSKPLYALSEAEVDLYLRFLQIAEPDLRRRVVHLARKNIGQPYELYLLGEMPFEYYDPQPIYCLDKSDCLVYSEHTYAMALGRNWSHFMLLLQRIRYRDGQLGVVTRNHYTEADWNQSNRWLVHDITAEIAGAQAVTFKQKIDRARFFKKRYQLEVDVPVEEHVDIYLPFDKIDLAIPYLQNGDFVNIVRGIVKPGSKPNATFGGGAWVGHVGMIALGEEQTQTGRGEVHFIHSSKPVVREETIAAYIARNTQNLADRDAAGKSRLVGFKFLRLQQNPHENLRKLDGPDAPKVTLPSGQPWNK